MIFKNLFPVLLLSSSFCFLLLLLAAFTKPELAVQPMPVRMNLHGGFPPTDTVPGVFEKVEVEAYFPGGENTWHSYLEKNLNALVPVQNGAPEGTFTVLIQFIVDTDGKLSEFKALTKHGFGMENEVMRILRKSPPWIPAVQDGRNVKAYRKQPVTFQITTEGKKKKNRS